MKESLARFGCVFNGRQPGAVVGDRGFDSATNRKLVEQGRIYNAICPKGVTDLRGRMQEERFAVLQGRRGHTEGRIGIFKNGFLGRPVQSKGFFHRELHITWSVLAHNLWAIARLPAADEERGRRRTAA